MSKIAVTALIVRDGLVLGVARRGTTDAWGLPGGKPEPGETPEQSIVREVEEETGITLEAATLREIFSKVDDNGYLVTTFRAETDAEPQQGDAGSVGFVTVNEMLSGPFPQYLTELFTQEGLM